MDVPSKTDTVVASDSGLTPSTIPGGCNNAQNGVSVENVPPQKEGYDWYVFRASYGREDKAVDLLGALHADTYIARHTVYTRTKTGVKSSVKKLLPNLVFAYLTTAEAALFTKGPDVPGTMFHERTKDDQHLIAELSLIVSYYYNHFQQDAFGKNPPLTIPYRSMLDFIIATSTSQDVMPVVEQQYEIGEEVEVVVGEFKGLRGKVIRQQRNKGKLYVQLHAAPIPSTSTSASGSFSSSASSSRSASASRSVSGSASRQRLFFQLPCLGSFSSALIPTAYFRKVE